MQPRFEWDGSLVTGDALVDSQHRTLIGMFNKLCEIDVGDCSQVIVSTTLETLSEYVSLHFAAEETLMVEHDYPEEQAAEHREQHRRLSDRTRTMILDFSAGRVGTATPVVELMCEWLSDHIDRFDRALVDHVQAQQDLAG